MTDNRLLMAVTPIASAVAVDISATDFTPTQGTCRAIYVGTAGDVVVTGIDNQNITYKNLAAGIYHSIRAKKIIKTGTTALNIVLGY